MSDARTLFDMTPQVPTWEPPPRTAETARDEALERVSREQFMRKALAAVRALPPGQYTGEQIRLSLESRGLSPHHHNAWGALTMSAVRAGILVDTGLVEHMQERKSHGRKTAVYEKV